jgi:hypothetical protein
MALVAAQHREGVLQVRGLLQRRGPAFAAERERNRPSAAPSPRKRQVSATLDADKKSGRAPAEAGQDARVLNRDRGDVGFDGGTFTGFGAVASMGTR